MNIEIPADGTDDLCKCQLLGIGSLCTQDVNSNFLMIESTHNLLLIHRFPSSTFRHVYLQNRDNLSWLIHFLQQLEAFQTH